MDAPKIDCSLYKYTLRPNDTRDSTIEQDCAVDLSLPPLCRSRVSELCCHDLSKLQ